MLAAPAPFLPAPTPASRPTPRERQVTWATIFVSLAVFWYVVGVAVNALWDSFGA